MKYTDVRALMPPFSRPKGLYKLPKSSRQLKLPGTDCIDYSTESIYAGLP